MEGSSALFCEAKSSIGILSIHAMLIKGYAILRKVREVYMWKSEKVDDNVAFRQAQRIVRTS